MIWDNPIHKEQTTAPRLLKPGDFPTGILELLPSVAVVKRRERGLYIAQTRREQARVLLTWAPYIDTAYSVSAYRLSDFRVLDNYVPFYERPIRKVVEFVDILLITGLRGDMREEDKRFIRHLLDKRARKNKPTVVDFKLPKDVWQDQYDDIIQIKE